MTAATVRERPILFSGAMVRAILDGSKSQTRRVLAFPPIIAAEGEECRVEFDRMQPGYADGSTRAVFDYDGEPNSFAVRCPYGQPGDRLWVRETWMFKNWSDRDLVKMGFAPDSPKHPTETYLDTPTRAIHRADTLLSSEELGQKWKPSIHMPRWASRLTLEITGVRVERVQEITSADCIAEGIPSRGLDRDGPCIASAMMYLADYEALWDSLNASRGYGWDVNPWVFVIDFRRLP